MSIAQPDDPLDAAVRISRAFENHGVPYAIGGAIAYGLWAVPRATVDVDVNVFVSAEELDRVVDLLRSLGVRIGLDEARRQNAREGMFIGRWGFYRIDVFMPSIDFSWEAEKTRVRHEIAGCSMWFLSAEAIAIFKLLFFRTKDIGDIERLVAVRPEIDHTYIRRKIVEMMGEGDVRVAEWDRIVREYRR